MIRVEGHKNLYRDENSGAIINCDFTGYDNYVRSLKSKEKEKDEGAGKQGGEGAGGRGGI